MMKSLLRLLSLSSLLVGCSPYWYKGPEKFAVQDSGLNWVQIYYQVSEEAPRIRCDMRDSGQIIVLEGKSVTVGDDFNIEYNKRDFGDVRKYHYKMSPELFVLSLQMLVDTGLMKKEEIEKDSPVYPKVLVKANINHQKIDKYVLDPDLIAEIRTQLFQFKMSGMLH